MIWAQGEADDSTPEQREKELMNSLLTNERVRLYCGIIENPDGTYWVGDLERVKVQSDETKSILRKFLKLYGRKPIEEVKSPDLESPVDKKYRISEELRKSLDELYNKIDKLKFTAKPSKYLRGNK